MRIRSQIEFMKNSYEQRLRRRSITTAICHATILITVEKKNIFKVKARVRILKNIRRKTKQIQEDFLSDFLYVRQLEMIGKTFAKRLLSLPSRNVLQRFNNSQVKSNQK